MLVRLAVDILLIPLVGLLVSFAQSVDDALVDFVLLAIDSIATPKHALCLVHLYELLQWLLPVFLWLVSLILMLKQVLRLSM